MTKSSKKRSQSAIHAKSQPLLSNAEEFKLQKEKDEALK